MSLAFSIAAAADKAGLRRPLAWAASRLYGDRAFSVDDRGHWVNRQRPAVFVSPSLHNVAYAALKSSVLRDLCHAYMPKPGDVIMDIGAGIGEEAAVFSRLVQPAGTVYAIEAHPDTFDCLTRTVALSHLANVVPLQCAVSDKDGEVSIGPTSDNHLANSVVAGTGGQTVPARSIESLAREHGIERIDFLYMNIEGAERDAINGIGAMLPNIGHMLISCHDFCAHAGESYRTREEARYFLERNGFRITTRPHDQRPWVRDFLYAAR